MNGGIIFVSSWEKIRIECSAFGLNTNKDLLRQIFLEILEQTCSMHVTVGKNCLALFKGAFLCFRQTAMLFQRGHFQGWSGKMVDEKLEKGTESRTPLTSLGTRANVSTTVPKKSFRQEETMTNTREGKDHFFTRILWSKRFLYALARKAILLSRLAWDPRGTTLLWCRTRDASTGRFVLCVPSQAPTQARSERSPSNNTSARMEMDDSSSFSSSSFCFDFLSLPTELKRRTAHFLATHDVIHLSQTCRLVQHSLVLRKLQPSRRLAIPPPPLPHQDDTLTLRRVVARIPVWNRRVHSLTLSISYQQENATQRATCLYVSAYPARTTVPLLLTGDDTDDTATTTTSSSDGYSIPNLIKRFEYQRPKITSEIKI